MLIKTLKPLTNYDITNLVNELKIKKILEEYSCVILFRKNHLPKKYNIIFID